MDRDHRAFVVRVQPHADEWFDVTAFDEGRTISADAQGRIDSATRTAHELPYDWAHFWEFIQIRRTALRFTEQMAEVNAKADAMMLELTGHHLCGPASAAEKAA